MSTVVDLKPLHRYSSADYHRLAASGGLEDMHVELLEGVLVMMSPRTREHEDAIALLNQWLSRGLDPDRYLVRVGGSLSLAEGFEPEPDLAVITPETPKPYHPGSAVLVIEVAVSSRRRDLGLKARVYAAAGVPVYFVLDLDRRRLVEHLDPTGDGYRSVREVERLDPRLPGLEPLDAGELIEAAFE